MPSKSPHTSASSPGPASSQSSSSGSHYSSSVSSSARQAASSDTSSVRTSPPSLVESLGKHYFSPVSKGIRQTQEDAQQQHQAFLHHLQHHQPQQSSVHFHDQAAFPNPSPVRSLQSSLMEQSLDQPATLQSHNALASSSRSSTSPAMSHAVRRYEGGWPSASSAPSGSHAQAYPLEEPMAVDHNVHAGVVHNFGTSPETSRGPLAKTRRTSPGGSRASGELRPTLRSEATATASSDSPSWHPAYEGSRASSSTTRHPPSGRGMADTIVRSASASEATPAIYDAAAAAAATDHPQSRNHPFDRSWSAGMSQYQAAFAKSADPANNLKVVSPRTRTADRSSCSPSTTSAVPPTSAGSGDDRASPMVASALSTSAPTARTPQLPKMNLATFPPQDLLKVLATLLHEIASANDELRLENGKDDGSRRSKSRSKEPSASDADPTLSGGHRGIQPYSSGSHLSFTDARRPSTTTAALGALATPSSTLCFHARNVPSISIESYLLRILKYCPTTNEVFLSLLVYFDRMSRMGTGAKLGANGDREIAGEAAGLPRAAEMANRASVPAKAGGGGSNSSGGASVEGYAGERAPEDEDEMEAYTHPGIKGFAIDSYNVHRLVIAGVTVASKFFSDVFYTNSRYAKVGGLPVHELNQLELQFLLLNDFRLTIPLDEMQRYADQLLMYGSGRPDGVSRVREPSLPVEASASVTSARMCSSATGQAVSSRTSSSRKQSDARPSVPGTDGQQQPQQPSEPLQASAPAANSGREAATRGPERDPLMQDVRMQDG